MARAVITTVIALLLALYFGDCADHTGGPLRWYVALYALIFFVIALLGARKIPRVNNRSFWKDLLGIKTDDENDQP